MKNKQQYRFKTEAEFKAEFGNEWYNTVPKGWAKKWHEEAAHMDDFLGKPFVGEIPQKDSFIRFEGWSISPEMLTTHRLPKLLADGTIAKVGMKVRFTESDTYALIEKVYISEPDQIVIRCFCKGCVNIKGPEGYGNLSILLSSLTKFSK